MTCTLRKLEQVARGERRSFVVSGTREKRTITTRARRGYAANPRERAERPARRAPAPAGVTGHH